MQKDSKIYIAGHTGLVGSSLLRRLQEEGYVNIIYRSHEELDLTRQAETEEFFRHERPEYVFLAAARVGGIVANMTYPAEFIYQNLMISINIIHASYKSEVKKLLNLGTSCIYPKDAPQPLKEEFLLTGKLEPTNEAYSIAKIAAIKLCRYYNTQYGTNYISVMPTNLYGIHDSFNLETSHVIPALIRKFHLAKLLRNRQYDLIKMDIKKRFLGFGIDDSIDLNSEESLAAGLKRLGIMSDNIILWGSGDPYREFLYIDDLARACIFIMRKNTIGESGELINIGSGSELRIGEIATIIKNIVGYKGDIKYNVMKPDGMFRKLLDCSKISELGWKPSVALTDGIEMTYKWYENSLIE